MGNGNSQILDRILRDFSFPEVDEYVPEWDLTVQLRGIPMGNTEYTSYTNQPTTPVSKRRMIAEMRNRDLPVDAIVNRVFSYFEEAKPPTEDEFVKRRIAGAAVLGVWHNGKPLFRTGAAFADDADALRDSGHWNRIAILATRIFELSQGEGDITEGKDSSETTENSDESTN